MLKEREFPAGRRCRAFPSPEAARQSSARSPAHAGARPADPAERRRRAGARHSRRADDGGLSQCGGLNMTAAVVALRERARWASSSGSAMSTPAASSAASCKRTAPSGSEGNESARASLSPCCHASAPATGCASTRIKDITSVQGVRQNQLIGYGLVIGLQGTGDTHAQLALHRAGAAVDARPDGRERARTCRFARATSPR